MPLLDDAQVVVLRNVGEVWPVRRTFATERVANARRVPGLPVVPLVLIGAVVDAGRFVVGIATRAGANDLQVEAANGNSQVAPRLNGNGHAERVHGLAVRRSRQLARVPRLLAVGREEKGVV